MLLVKSIRQEFIHLFRSPLVDTLLFATSNFSSSKASDYCRRQGTFFLQLKEDTLKVVTTQLQSK